MAPREGGELTQAPRHCQAKQGFGVGPGGLGQAHPRTGPDVSGTQPLLVAWPIARSSLLSVRSRPSRATVTSMGGEMVPPVTATRNGWATLPRPAPARSATPAMTACTAAA